MTVWFYNGGVAALILGIMVAEFFLLFWLRPVALRALWPSLCAGGLLLAAWLVSALHAPWFLVALTLLLAGGAHLADVFRTKQ